MSDVIIKKNTEPVGLVISPDKLGLLGAVQTYPKGAPKGLKRLIRIRLNLFRELEAFNKELRRHNLKSVWGGKQWKIKN